MSHYHQLSPKNNFRLYAVWAITARVIQIAWLRFFQQVWEHVATYSRSATQTACSLARCKSSALFDHIIRIFDYIIRKPSCFKYYDKLPAPGSAQGTRASRSTLATPGSFSLLGRCAPRPLPWCYTGFNINLYFVVFFSERKNIFMLFI